MSIYRRIKMPASIKPGEKQIAVAYSQSSMNAEFNKTMRYVVLGYFVNGEKPTAPLSSLPFNHTKADAAQKHFKCAKTLANVDTLEKWYQKLADAVNANTITFKQAWWIAALSQACDPALLKSRLAGGSVPKFNAGSGKVDYPIQWVPLTSMFNGDPYALVSAINKIDAQGH